MSAHSASRPRAGAPACRGLLALALGVPALQAAVLATPTEQWSVDITPSTPPVVVQLDDDDGDGAVTATDGPDLVVLQEGGLLTALDGATGEEHWSVSTGALDQHLAAADIDADGTVELLLSDMTSLIIVSHEGVVETTQAWPAGTTWAPDSNLGVADLDGDGRVEAHLASAVMTVGGGGLSWAVGHSTEGLHYCNAADLDPLLAGLELACAPSVRSSDGLPVHDLGIAVGSTAVGDVNNDGEVELVVAEVLDGWTWLHVIDADGTPLAPRELLSGGGAGLSTNPIVVDTDGNGVPNVVVPDSTQLFAREWDGTALGGFWSRPLPEGSSWVTAFDFDGDGAAEIAWRDIEGWTITPSDNRDFVHRTEAPTMSPVRPVIADLDQDTHPEIVIVGPGLQVWEMLGARPARAAWNQQTYHGCNVGLAGEIPLTEDPAWSTHGSWGAQVERGACGECTLTSSLRDELSVCRGADLILDAAGVVLAGCPDESVHEWSRDGVPLGSGERLVLEAIDSGWHDLRTSCSTDPSCWATDSMQVIVDAPPVFDESLVRATSCGQSIRLSWPAAEFATPEGGRYHVFRSISECPLVPRTAVATSLTELSWVDWNVSAGRTYYYSVEAEGRFRPTTCLPTGHFGGARTVACVAPASTRIEAPGPALRARRDGDDIEWSWGSARELSPGEHYVLRESRRSPQGLYFDVHAGGLTTRSHRHVTESPFSFYLLSIESACGAPSEREPADDCIDIAQGTTTVWCTDDWTGDWSLAEWDGPDFDDLFGCDVTGVEAPPRPGSGQWLAIARRRGTGCEGCSSSCTIPFPGDGGGTLVYLDIGFLGDCDAEIAVTAWALVNDLPSIDTFVDRTCSD
ncbi:MAG: VCBS repeat-containing protein [Acidobacteriota bacterium]